MEQKKTVLFVVEGPSDKTALEKIFKVIYKGNRNIDFKFTSGDISSNTSVTVTNVCDRIYDFVDEFIKDRKLKKSDIYQIVQIFDMDGAYAPEESIIEGDNSEFIYSTTNIRCKNTQKVKKRNELKKSVINYLLSQQEIRGIPYEMYFMSCNLDHALYDEMNLVEDLKQKYADAFYEKFMGKEKLFIDFLKSEVVNGVPDSFPASWSYIKSELHSLERHTNLHIYFIKNPRPDGLL